MRVLEAREYGQKNLVTCFLIGRAVLDEVVSCLKCLVIPWAEGQVRNVYLKIAFSSVTMPSKNLGQSAGEFSLLSLCGTHPATITLRIVGSEIQITFKMKRK